MNRTRNIVVAVLLVLGIIVVMQNTEEVETRLLFATLTMPRALLLAITLAVGIVVGLLISSRSKRKTEA